MDDIVKATSDWTERVRNEALDRRQQLLDALDRVNAILDTIDVGGRRLPAAREKYDVIDDIVPLVRNAAKPLLQSEIFAAVKQKVMDKMRFTEREAQASVYRSLWYHTKHGPGANDDRGIRAVDGLGPRCKVVSFKTKGSKTQYPDNLIWHVDRLKAAS